MPRGSPVVAASYQFQFLFVPLDLFEGEVVMTGSLLPLCSLIVCPDTCHQRGDNIGEISRITAQPLKVQPKDSNFLCSISVPIGKDEHCRPKSLSSHEASVEVNHSSEAVLFIFYDHRSPYASNHHIILSCK